MFLCQESKEDDAEADRIRQERVKAYEAKKAKSELYSN